MRTTNLFTHLSTFVYLGYLRARAVDRSRDEAAQRLKRAAVRAQEGAKWQLRDAGGQPGQVGEADGRGEQQRAVVVGHTC
eukprot:8678789-Pyramimonas_sp.AAC.1